MSNLYCKCTCTDHVLGTTNSTIVDLPAKSRCDDCPAVSSCTDCTRAFCLSYNLPVCNEAKEEDVFTTCFQRDSIKDASVVYIFIVLTVALLGWALVAPWVRGWIDKARARRRYEPLAGGGT